jgi:hypothetical protein
LDILQDAPDSYLRQQGKKPINLTDRLRQGEPLTSLAAWNQFAHTMHMTYLDLVHQGRQAAADTLYSELEEAVNAVLTGPNALQTEDDGCIVIGHRAYGATEAPGKAREFVDYLVDKEQFPPSPFPHQGPENTPLDLSSLPKKEQTFYRTHYPDVIQKYNQKIKEVVWQTKQAFQKEGKLGKLIEGDAVYPTFKSNFKNGGIWDLQVNPDFPHQAVVFDAGGHVQYTEKGFVKTTDEFAIYNNKLVKAGYLSNHIYGYASAAGKLSKDEMYFDAWFVGSTKGGQPLGDLNKHDNEAMSDGYDQYWKDYPNENRTNFFWEHR